MLDLIGRNLAVAAIVELGRSGALVRRHLLGIFEEPAVDQINRLGNCQFWLGQHRCGGYERAGGQS